jgi:hypothetical protein
MIRMIFHHVIIGSDFRQASLVSVFVWQNRPQAWRV